MYSMYPLLLHTTVHIRAKIHATYVNTAPAAYSNRPPVSTPLVGSELIVADPNF